MNQHLTSTVFAYFKQTAKASQGTILQQIKLDTREIFYIETKKGLFHAPRKFIACLKKIGVKVFFSIAKCKVLDGVTSAASGTVHKNTSFEIFAINFFVFSFAVFEQIVINHGDISNDQL